MELLEQRILKDGVVIGTDILKVDQFLNHQVDPLLLLEMGKEFKRLFEKEHVTKVLTVEASGIAIASFAALELKVPFVFAKKYNARNLDRDFYEAEVYSFTKNRNFIIRVACRYLNPGDRVLIIDDFLANGCALLGLIDIVKQAGAEVAGCGIAIEKGFQDGGQAVRDTGVRVESLAVVERMSEDEGIVFRKTPVFADGKPFCK